MMARVVGVGVAAGMSSSAAVMAAPLFAPSVSCYSPDGDLVHSLKYRPLHLPALLRASWSSPAATGSFLRIQTLAPSALYTPALSMSSKSAMMPRSSECVQLGISILRGSGKARRCGVTRGMAAGTENELETLVKKTNSSEPVVVWSKTYCPYCMRVKKLLGSLGYDVQVIELDTTGQPGLQDALERVSGQYTVPNVYIGGKHIGGCDDTVALHSRGQLEPLLEAAGAKKK